MDELTINDKLLRNTVCYQLAKSALNNECPTTWPSFSKFYWGRFGTLEPMNFHGISQESIHFHRKKVGNRKVSSVPNET